MFLLFRRSFKDAIFNKFLKVAIATSNFVNEGYNGGFPAEFSVYTLKTTVRVTRRCV